MREVELKIRVRLDEDNLPSEITWQSQDPPSNGDELEAKAFFLSIFDKESLETLKIDLWVKKFEIGEMNRMTYYTLKSLADSYYKATNNTSLANDFGRFTQYFGEETGLLKGQ
jgi:gliding motility-associated protein GldC